MGEFDIDLLQYQEAGVLPLRGRAAVFEDGSHRLVIEDVQSLDRGPELRVRTSRATAALDRQVASGIYYYLRNRQAGEALGGKLQPWSYAPIPGQFVVGRYGLLGSPFGFTLGSGYLRFPSTVWAQLRSSLARMAVIDGPTTTGCRERNSSSSKRLIPALSSGDSN